MTGKIFTSILAIYILSINMSCSPGKKLPAPTADNNPVPVNTDSSTVTLKTESREDEFLVDLMKSSGFSFDSVLANRKKWKVQVIYTQVNRTNQGEPQLQHYYFNRQYVSYFYPASTVKFPVALLALEKLNSLKNSGIDKNSTMITEAAFSGQTATYNDPNTADGKPTIAQYIKRILLVSDNDAFNRLYEFLGQDYINNALHKKGYNSAQIIHRLNIFLSEEENRRTNPVKFFDNTNTLLQSFPEQVSKLVYAVRNDQMGTAYYSNGSLQNKPLDFSKKNRISLEDLHKILISLVLPGAVPAQQRFNITEDDRKFMLQYMSQYPQESVYPSFDSTYHDAYVKFLYYGAHKGSLPKNIRIFNKVGDAYGQLTDVAYIVDFERKIEFFVSASIYCNEDEILNDDHYDYDSIGFPFMQELGKAIYKYELGRKKNIQPDLTPLIFQYDK